MLKMVKVEKNPQVPGALIITARDKDYTFHKFYPLPGNTMFFDTHVPEEIDSEGHLVMMSMTNKGGSEISFPRRGLPIEVAEKLGDMMGRISDVFAPLLAEQTKDPIPEDE